MKGAVTSTYNEVLGPRNPNHKGWISTETINKIEERKAKKAAVNKSQTRIAKAKAQEEYKGVSRSVKTSLTAQKHNYWSHWQQKLKRQLVMEICRTFMLP